MSPSSEAAYLEAKGVYCLPVSEVENLLLLPGVFLALAKALQFSEGDAETRLAALRAFVLTQASQQIDAICIRFTKRRIDAAMKRIGLTGTDSAALDTEFKAAVAGIDPPTIFGEAKSALSAAIDASEYKNVLNYYDNKGLLAEAARQLGYQQRALEEFIGRALRSDESTELHAALAAALPTVTPRP